MKKQSEHSDRHLAIADAGAVVPDLISEVQDKIIRIRDCAVIVDADVASLYGVGTKHVNQAVRNNPDKFPADYMFELTDDEARDLRSKTLTANLSSKSRVLPKAFT